MNPYDQKEINRQKRNAKARQRLIDNPVEERAKRARFAREWRKRHPENREYNRKRLGTGEMPSSPDDIIFYGYKPPFRKFKGGFGYEGVLMYSKLDQKVQCHFCGRLFRAINNGHLKKVHNLTAREYKEKVGLSQGSALCGEETRKKLLERGHNPRHMEELRKAQEKRRERKKKGLPDLQSGTKLSLEKKNERGTCPEQLLDRIRDAIKKNGGIIPTMEEFVRMNEGKYYGSIRNTYGTWTNAVEKLGHSTHRNVYSEQDLLDSMQTFYRVHKRTPRWSDMKRGLLPSATAYYGKFRSMNNARLKAGVPLLIQYGHRSEEWVPTSAQREKMLSKI